MDQRAPAISTEWGQQTQSKRREEENTQGQQKQPQQQQILSQHANTVSAVNLVEKGTSNRSSGGGGGGSGRNGVTTVQLCNANGCCCLSFAFLTVCLVGNLKVELSTHHQLMMNVRASERRGKMRKDGSLSPLHLILQLTERAPLTTDACLSV